MKIKLILVTSMTTTMTSHKRDSQHFPPLHMTMCKHMVGYLKGTSYMLHCNIWRCCSNTIYDSKLSSSYPLFNNIDITCDYIQSHGTSMIFYVCLVFLTQGWLACLSTLNLFFSLTSYSFSSSLVRM